MVFALRRLVQIEERPQKLDVPQLRQLGGVYLVESTWPFGIQCISDMRLPRQDHWHQ